MTDLQRIQKFLAITSVKCFWAPDAQDERKFTSLYGEKLTQRRWKSPAGTSVSFAVNADGKLVGRIEVYNATTQAGSDLTDIEVFEEWLKKVSK